MLHAINYLIIKKQNKTKTATEIQHQKNTFKNKTMKQLHCFA